MGYYFAYGSCMSLKDIKRTVDAKVVGPAILRDYRLGFTRYSKGRQGGVADIVPAVGEVVEGMLFDVDGFDELDTREGAPFFYQRCKVKVTPFENKKEVEAITYEVVQKSNKEIVPSEEYMSIIQDGALQLSKQYQESLEKRFAEFRTRNGGME